MSAEVTTPEITGNLVSVVVEVELYEAAAPGEVARLGWNRILQLTAPIVGVQPTAGGVPVGEPFDVDLETDEEDLTWTS